MGILDDRAPLERLASTEDLSILCKKGAVSTTHGWVGYAIFAFLNRGASLATYCMYLNPHDPTSMGLLHSLARQREVKMLLMASDGSGFAHRMSCDNEFAFDTLTDHLDKLAATTPPGDFEKAKDEVAEKFPLKDLLDASDAGKNAALQ